MDDNADLILDAVAGRAVTSRGWIRASCPFCEWNLGTPDRSVSFGYRPMTGKYTCYRCGIYGWIPLDEDALEYAALKERKQEIAKIQPPPGYFSLSTSEPLGSVLWDPINYLLSRGASNDTLREIRIGACVTGRYANRVIVPILSPTGDWLWFVARSWNSTEKRRRYLYPVGDRGDIMMNQAALAQDTDTPVLAVEGVFDAIPHWPNVVAFLGKPREGQIHALASAKRPVIVGLDGDLWATSRTIAQRLCLAGRRAGYLHLPPKTDPNDFRGKKIFDYAHFFGVS